MCNFKSAFYLRWTSDIETSFTFPFKILSLAFETNLCYSIAARIGFVSYLQCTLALIKSIVTLQIISRIRLTTASSWR